MSQPTLSTSTGWIWEADRDPGADETANIAFGNFWINTNTNTLFQCTDATSEQMQWTPR